MVGPLLVGEMIESGFIEAVSENFRCVNTASVVEKELEVASMTGGVGICNRFGVAERVEERAKCPNLISDFRLSFRVCREPEDLIYEESSTEALARSCDPPCVCNASDGTSARS